MTIGQQSAVTPGGVPGGIDVAAIRARTPGVATRHYFNAAGSGLISEGVFSRVVGHLALERDLGGYEAAYAVVDEAEGVYGSAAALIGAAPSEIALFDTATTGLRAIFDAMRLGDGDTIVASRSTYVSQALRQLAMRRYDGVELVVVPNGPDGAIDLDALDRAVASAGSGAVISIAHVPTSSGLVEPVAEVGEIARRHAARYVLDATQSIGQIDVDVDALGCDALVTTGRKFLRGPRGTAFAYIRQAFLATLPSWAPDVRGANWETEDEWSEHDSGRKLETWEHNVAARLGLGVALQEHLALGPALVERHLETLGAGLRTRLAEIPGVSVVDPPAARGAIVTFVVDGVQSKAVADILRQRSVDSISTPASHAQWDLGARGLASVVRIAPHVYNDEHDVDVLLGCVAEIAVEGQR